MDALLERANLFFARVPDRVRRYRLWVWLLLFVSSALVISGAGRFHIDMTMEAYFQRDDPAKLAYDRFRAEFGSDEVVFLSYRAQDGDVFSDASLKALQGLHRELRDYRLTLPVAQSSGLDHIREITSLINASFMHARDGVLLSTPLIGEQLPATEQEREALRRKTLSHPDYPGVYVSEDSGYAAIVIRTDIGATLSAVDALSSNESSASFDGDGAYEGPEDDFDDIDMVENWQPEQLAESLAPPQFEQADIEDFAALMHAIEPLMDKAQYREHLEFFPVGGAPIMTFFHDEVIRQLTLVFAGSVLLILLVLWLLFRSLSAVVWSLVIILLSFLWVLGLIGWSGAVMTMMINIIVFLVLAAGVADAVHILSGYLYFRREDEDHEQALRSVFKKSGLACFLTSLTTAIGLMALTLVPIVPVRNFGIFAAIGVLMAFVLTVFVLPLMLDLWSPVKKTATKQSSLKKPLSADDTGGTGVVSQLGLLQRGLRSVEHIGYSYPRTVVAVFAVIAIYLLIGVTKIYVDTNMIALMPEGTAERHSVDVIDEHMAGSNVMDILFDAGSPDAFQQPDMLRRVEALEQFILREYPERVGKISSLVNINKDSYKSLHDDDPAMYKIPARADVLAQSLFMFNSANPEDRAQFVSDDYSKTRMTIILKNAGSHVYVPMIEHIQTEIDRKFASAKTQYPQLKVQLTGAMSLMLRLVDYVSWSQIKSFAVALAVISALLLVVFGSKRIGLIALIPNLFPILLAFGVMGHFAIPLDTDTLLVAPIIIGIAVDDTIHFLNHYRVGVLQSGDIKASIRQTIREAGQAITFTSIILSVGFLVFLFCSHTALRNFGILSALAILFALVTDLLLLPALCWLFKADFGRREAPDHAHNKNTNDAAEGLI